MLPVPKRDAGVWPQTRSLLYKNLLIKWRTKQQTLQVTLGGSCLLTQLLTLG